MNTVCQQHSICQLCEENKTKYVLRNIHIDKRLGVCTECVKGFSFKDHPREEIKP